MATRCKLLQIAWQAWHFWDVLILDGSLARNIDFEVATSYKLVGKRRFLKLHSVKIGGKSRTKCSFWCSNVSRLESLVSSGLAVSTGEAAKPILFEGFQAGCHVVFAWQACHLVIFSRAWNVLKVVLCGRRNTFVSFSKDELQFSWQVYSTLETSTLSIRGRRSTLDVLCCVFVANRIVSVKWRQRAIRVAGVGHRKNVILRGKRVIWCGPPCVECPLAWQAQCFGHFTLDTPHSTLDTPYTPHLTLHSLHLTHRTLHSTLDALDSTFHTLHFTLHTSHSTLDTPRSTLPSTLYDSRLYTPHSTLYTLHYTLHATLSTLHSALYTLHFTLDTPHSTLYTPHSTLYTPHFTLYTLHSTLYKSKLQKSVTSSPHSALYTSSVTSVFMLHVLLPTLYMQYASRFMLPALHSFFCY